MPSSRRMCSRTCLYCSRRCSRRANSAESLRRDATPLLASLEATRGKGQKSEALAAWPAGGSREEQRKMSCSNAEIGTHEKLNPLSQKKMLKCLIYLDLFRTKTLKLCNPEIKMCKSFFFNFRRKINPVFITVHAAKSKRATRHSECAELGVDRLFCAAAHSSGKNSRVRLEVEIWHMVWLRRCVNPAGDGDL